MRSLLILLALVVPSPTWAEDLPDVTKVCSTWREFGRGVMTSRQIPMTIEETLARWSSVSMVGEKGVEAARKAVFAAFDTPLFMTPDAQERAIAAFAEHVERECYRSYGF